MQMGGKDEQGIECGSWISLRGLFKDGHRIQFIRRSLE